MYYNSVSIKSDPKDLSDPGDAAWRNVNLSASFPTTDLCWAGLAVLHVEGCGLEALLSGSSGAHRGREGQTGTDRCA